MAYALQNINVIKKGRLRNCSRFLKTKEIRWLNATFNPQLDP